DWKAAATYQSGNYGDSAASYAKLQGDENRYNLGNALARSGKLEDAIAAYDQVLAKAPGHADAKFNRDLVQHLLDEQKKQQEQQKQSQQQSQQGGQGQQQGQGGHDQQAQQKPDQSGGSSGGDGAQQQAQNDQKPNDQTKDPQQQGA